MPLVPVLIEPSPGYISLCRYIISQHVCQLPFHERHMEFRIIYLYQYHFLLDYFPPSPQLWFRFITALIFLTQTHKYQEGKTRFFSRCIQYSNFRHLKRESNLWNKNCCNRIWTNTSNQLFVNHVVYGLVVEEYEASYLTSHYRHQMIFP